MSAKAQKWHAQAECTHVTGVILESFFSQGHMTFGVTPPKNMTDDFDSQRCNQLQLHARCNGLRFFWLWINGQRDLCTRAFLLRVWRIDTTLRFYFCMWQLSWIMWMIVDHYLVSMKKKWTNGRVQKKCCCLTGLTRNPLTVGSSQATVQRRTVQSWLLHREAHYV